jgi:Lon-like protease
MSSKIETIATNADQKDSEVTDTQSEMVSVPAPIVRHTIRKWGIATFVLGLVAPAVIGFRAVHFVAPNSKRSIAFLPGEASTATGRISTGALKAYRPEGDVLFVTVSQLPLTDLTLQLAQEERAVDFATRRDVYGDRTAKQSEVEDRRVMGYSKDFASYVALKRLGYDVKVSDGGVVVRSLSCEKFAADEKTCEVEVPATKVLKPQDLITAVNGDAVNTSDELTTALSTKKRGDKVDVTIDRAGTKLVVSVELVSIEDRAIIGFIPDPSPPDTIKFSIPQGVSIDSGDVGGPSAGLAFTLALLEQLTPGSLTGGVKVAATGTMSPSGAVGLIGELKLKTVAVKRAGAKVFLVPEAQKDEAIAEAAGSDLKVIGVRTLDDALGALADLGGNSLQLGQPGAATGG